MKTLLTIIILTISANLCGQDALLISAKLLEFQNRADMIDSVYYPSLNDGYFYDKDRYQRLESACLLLPLLNEYKQDCYNDSTWTHTYLPSWSSGCLRQEGNLAYGYEFVLDCNDSTHYEWIHKEPTFVDFIEWLNKY